MSGFSVKGDKLKTLLKHAKKEAISFGLNPGKSVEDAVLCLHKTKAAKVLGKAAKDEGKGKKVSFGQVELDDKTLRLTCLNPPLPQMAKLMKRYLKSQKVMLNVEILDANGQLLESAAEEELPENASESPSPDDGQAEIMKKLSDIGGRIKTLSPKMQARVIKHFQKVHGLAKTGKLKGASAGADKLEAALDKMEKTSGSTAAKSAEEEAKSVFGEAQASPVDPMRLKALQSRMAQVAAIEVPPLMVRVKPQVLQKAKELLDSGKLDEASKLLEAFAAKVPPARPSKPAPASAPSSPSAAKAAEEDSKSKSGDSQTPQKFTVEGTDFSDGDKMMDFVKKFGEELQAMINLVDDKSAAGADKSQCDEYKKKCDKLRNTPINLEAKRMEAYAGGDEKVIAAAHKKYQEMIKEKRDLAKSLKSLWEKDQRKRLDAELQNGKNTSSEAMAAAFGDEFLEMAQMAEVQAKKKGLDPFKSSKGGLKEPMEMGEIAAIYGYSTQDYTKVNGLLRGKKDPDVDPSAFMSYIEACKKGLDKLPPYKGEAVRCDKTAAYFFKEVLSSGKRTEKAFMSTGTTLIPGFGDVVTRIKKVKTGKEISAFSLHDKEEEVLFPPGSVFKFVKFKAGKKTITNYKKLGEVVNEKTDKGEFFFEQVR